ncbi:hypothetical protein V9K67_21900 [Paraflavisolibacter sp. H34]|uniref:hypothetical protein n=1 Tax=Huijunlia imazamoxiresistens TaxID=3127457 RepID=UPI003015C8C3
MNAFYIAGHPRATIITFCLVMISGEAFGGPYLIYLLLALPHGGLYSLVGVGGILCLYIGHKIQGTKKHWVKPVLQLSGILLTILSLFIFFALDRRHYNYGTFEQTVPLVTLFLFGLSALCGIILAMQHLSGRKREQPHSQLRP